LGRIVEIGILREAVEILDEPRLDPDARIGRIKHRNGENVAISFDTLQDLMQVAREVRQTEYARGPEDRHDREESFFPA